mmetsp:Transcript_37488/g.69911  ORF Transcript_37488/g.69911 Transcript_37488/m.69911 type:complete len:187 (+) Transcript_37488:93-653(+)
MYVQYAGAGQVPYYASATPYQQAYAPAVGGGFVQPMQIATPQHYAAQPYTATGAPGYYQAMQGAYQTPVQQVQQVQALQHPQQAQYQGAQTVMQPVAQATYIQGHGCAQRPGEVPPTSVRTVPGAALGPNRVGTNLTQAQPGEVDDEDDPNRLPTFVKVRGLPAEHDPRIARRPKPKKRAPGICCA